MRGYAQGVPMGALDTEYKSREHKQRDAYVQFRAEVRQLFSESLLPAPSEIPFDPQDPRRAYDLLAAEAARILEDKLRGLLPSIRASLSRCVYLREFRHREVAEPIKMLEDTRKAVEQALTCIRPEEVLQYERKTGSLPGLCGAFAYAVQERNPVGDRSPL